MAMDAPTRTDLKFDYTCPKGLRVRLRPQDEINEWLRQQPHLADQVTLIDRRTAYVVDFVYEISPSVIFVKLGSFQWRFFNAFLFESATTGTTGTP